MRKLCLSLCLILLVIPCALKAAPQMEAKPAETIDELTARFSDDQCRTCHAAIYDEWKESFHSQSLLHSLGGMRNFVAIGIPQEWRRDVTKSDLMKCFHCHAPQLYDASEALVKKVGDTVVGAVDEKDPLKKEGFRKELARLNVNCIVCHNTVVHRPSMGWYGPPEKGVIYGTKGTQAPHKTALSATMKSSLFCGQCHGTYNPPDSDTVFCNTLHESYLNAYLPNGGQKVCQDCHMREKKRGHRFPGAYEADILRDGLDFEAEVTRYNHIVGKEWKPRIVATVNIYNKSGHRTPDG
jgi:hypothetical protein